MTIHSDNKAVNHSNRVTADRLLARRHPRLPVSSLTHVKATSVDGCWAYLGTGNFDYLDAL